MYKHERKWEEITIMNCIKPFGAYLFIFNTTGAIFYHALAQHEHR